jgi:hypothetical protein
MANRVLRDWTASDTIDKLSADAEVFFTRLIMKADDFGRFHAHPKLLIAALFPLKNIQPATISKWRDECAAAGLFNIYAVEGKLFLEIRNFGQRLRNMNSRFPDPVSELARHRDECDTADNTPSIDSNSPHVAARNGNGNGNGSAAPDCFHDNATAHSWIMNNYTDVGAAKKILSNLGWRSVTDVDIGALLYHFLEGLKDIQDRPTQDVRQHFSHWLQKKPINDLTKLSLTIQAEYARRGQGSG